jgi:hypothetical protein
VGNALCVVHSVYSLGGNRIGDAVASPRHRGWAAKRLMRTPSVVEGEPRGDAERRFAAVRRVFEIDVVVLERAPEPLENTLSIQHPPPASIDISMPAGSSAPKKAALVNRLTDRPVKA